MSYRKHPGLYEPRPLPPEVTIKFGDRWDEIEARIVRVAESYRVEIGAWEHRHAPELERMAYEASKAVKVPLVGASKAVSR